MPSKLAPLVISSLRGGLDDTSPPLSMAKDACRVAENVEFCRSTLGERRLGCEPIALPTGVDTFEAVTMMARHLPTIDEATAELWALFQDLDEETTPNFELWYRDDTTWTEVTTIDDPDFRMNGGQLPVAQTFHGNLFFGVRGDPEVDRLHVWDGTEYRRTGLMGPDTAPTVADEGSGIFDGIRYYRTRFIATPDNTTPTPVYRRSEPSPTTTFTPSGTGAGATIDQPDAVNEGETYWEIDASLDGANFFTIATLSTTVLDYDDEQPYEQGYAAIGTPAAPVGTYSLQPNARYLLIDNDRLVQLSSWTDETLGSRVAWSPVGLAPGVGNDERLDMNTDPELDLDGFEGGGITGAARPANGYIYVFKRGHIYKLVRTGQRLQAYEAISVTKAKGALPGTVVEAEDQQGFPAIYFLDPQTGPHRIGRSGLEWCGRDIQTFWRRVNRNALVPGHGVYYLDKRQVHYWVAVDGSDYPNAKIVVHTDEMRPTDEGVRRGWATVPVGDRIASALCSVMFSDNVDTTEPRNQNFKPFIGGEDTDEEFIQLTDIGTTDDGEIFYGSVKTAPFTFTGIANKAGVRAAALLAEASDDETHLMYVRLIRDFGLETITADTDLTAVGTEEQVIRQLDDLALVDARVMQFELGDLDLEEDPMTDWALNELMLILEDGEKA